MLNFIKKKKGMAIITVLMVIVILFILGFAIIMYANSTLLASSWQRNSVNSLYLAQAGLIYAYYHLSDKFTLAGAGDSSSLKQIMSTGWFEVTAALRPDGKVDVDSTGCAGMIKRKIHAVFDSKNSGSGFVWYP